MKKILNSKWTAVDPKNKEKHFVVIKLNYSKTDILVVESIILEAIFTKQHYTMSVEHLVESGLWAKGWA